MKEEMKKWMVEYKDRGGYGCCEEVEAIDENHAIRIVQMILLDDNDFMSRLVEVYEVEDDCSCDDCEPEWKLDDGTVLEQEHQDTLNDAMDSMVNKDGLTLREAMELKSKNE